jgi:hypothetical protein
MELIQHKPLVLKTFYVALRDGTIQEVQAGSFRLTSDNMWTFFKEFNVPKGTSGTVLHAVTSTTVRGIYNAKHVVLETVMERAAKGNITTEVRKRTPKKSVKPDASKTGAS